MTAHIAFVDVSYAYPGSGRLPVLDEVSAEVERGECVAITGPNGAGKSTLLKIAATLLSPTSGRLLYHGRPVNRSLRQVRRLINYTAGAPAGFYPRIGAVDNLRFFSGLKGRVASPDHCRALLERVGLTAAAEVRYGAMSLGMRQRLHLARMLLEPADVWIMDEPSNGLDAEGRELLEKLVAEAGDKTRLLVSHDAEALGRMTDRSISLAARA